MFYVLLEIINHLQKNDRSIWEDAIGNVYLFRYLTDNVWEFWSLKITINCKVFALAAH